MTEEKKEFNKTKHMSIDDVKAIINTEFGAQIKIQDVKVNHHIIMKILEPVTVGEYLHAGEPKKTHRFRCHYKPKGCEGFDLTVQVGEGAVTKLIEKFPNNAYVGMYAFFSRTQYQGMYPQFINPIKQYDEPKDKDELFKPKETTDTPQNTEKPSLKLDLSKFDDFKAKYTLMAKDPDMIARINPTHMIGCYIATYEEDMIKELKAKCEEALK